MAQRYDKDFRLHSVKQVTELNKSATQVTRDLKVAYKTNNACIESFHSMIKNEWIFYEKYHTRAQAQASILHYILHFYNYRRIYATIGYKTPIAYQKEYSKQKKSS